MHARRWPGSSQVHALLLQLIRSGTHACTHVGDLSLEDLNTSTYDLFRPQRAGRLDGEVEQRSLLTHAAQVRVLARLLHAILADHARDRLVVLDALGEPRAF